MLLDTVNHTLEIKLGGAVTTNELPVIVQFIDGEASNFFPTLQHSVSDGTTEVTILDAPEERAKRLVKAMTIRNSDTATATVTLQLDDNGTKREILKVIMLADETLIYTDTTGFKIIDTDGNTKVGGGGFDSPTGAVDIGDSASEGSATSHSRSDHQHAHAAPTAGYPVDADAAVEADGAATTPARSDHRHHVTVGVAPSNVTKATAAEGSNDSLSRSDHKHDVTTATPTDIGAANAEGSATSLARSDHVHKSVPIDISARVFNSAAQAILNSTGTVILFDSERYDTDTIHSTSTNTGRLTATTAGKYLITMTLGMTSNATGRRQLSLLLNGATNIGIVEWDTNQNSTTYSVVTTIYDLAATDYVEVVMFQSSGVTLNTIQAGDFSPEFMMHKLN